MNEPIEQRINDETLGKWFTDEDVLMETAPLDIALDLQDERAETEKQRNVIAALVIAVRCTHSISEERLQEMIAIVRGD